MRGGERECDHAAVRVAYHVGSIDPQVIQQTDRIAGLVVGRGRSRWTGASGEPATVVLDELEVIERWCGHQGPERVGKVGAVYQQHGVACSSDVVPQAHWTEIDLPHGWRLSASGLWRPRSGRR
jgi:hypothetical protein